MAKSNPPLVDDLPIEVWIDGLVRADDENHFPFYRVCVAFRTFGPAAVQACPP